MTALPDLMSGMVLTGHGGFDRLVWRDDLPVPRPGPGEVLIRVLASSVNNTDINTRIGWYSKSVRGDTASGGADGFQGQSDDDGSWTGEPLGFPRIQGADCCGTVVAVGDGVRGDRIGERVIVRTLQSTGAGGGAFETWTFGSECDGAFADYARTFAEDALPVRSDWSDIELASIPCAYSTAEGMLQRASAGAERILVTGASGGVGLAAVQLAKVRGAHVTAMTDASKSDRLRALGADQTVGRTDGLEPGSFDVVVDLVAGPRWPDMIDALGRGGRYVVAGAIAGPIVELDVRTLYLRDLTLFGSTWQPANILPDIVGYIESNRISPVVDEIYPLDRLVDAQRAFLEKRHVGKIGIDVAGRAQV